MSASTKRRLTKRDKAVIHSVAMYRVLSTTGIAALFFPTTAATGVNSQCLARLRFLTRAGYLVRREQLSLRAEGRSPYLYYLGPEGVRFLRDLGMSPADIDWRPSDANSKWLYLSHQLDVNRFRVTVALAAQRRGSAITQWIDDRALRRLPPEHVEILDRRGNARREAVVPDGMFSLVDGEFLHHLLVEVDRSTVTASSTLPEAHDWWRKVKVYLSYFDSDLPVARYGTDRFRVLTVTTTAKRLDTLKRVTEEAGGKHRFWFAVQDELTPENVLTAPVWHVAAKDERLSLLW